MSVVQVWLTLFVISVVSVHSKQVYSSQSRASSFASASSSSTSDSTSSEDDLQPIQPIPSDSNESKEMPDCSVGGDNQPNPDEQTPDQCVKNEEYSTCKIRCPPQLCSTLISPIYCLLPEDCSVSGCNCRKGYLRNGTTTSPCIPKTECPEYSQLIQTTSETPEGEEQTPDQCDINEEYSKCKIRCPPQLCSTLIAPIYCFAPDDCSVSGCNCKNGYLRNGTATSPCIPKTECPEYSELSQTTPETPESEGQTPDQCDINEEYNICKIRCPPQLCSTLIAPINCFAPDDCNVSGCNCKKGYLRNGTTTSPCIPKTECPEYSQLIQTNPETPEVDIQSNKCGKNEEWSECRQICPPQTCLSLDIKVKCRSDIPCEAGCNCKKNYLRNGNTTAPCIKQKECPRISVGGTTPSPICGKNEIYTNCMRKYCLQDCASLSRRHSCPLIPTDCYEPGCVCKDDYLRNNKGICVPRDQCGISKCPENEVFLNCTLQKCNHNCSDLAEPRACRVSLDCYQPGCVCQSDWLWNDSGECVPQDQCSTPTSCGANEQYLTCGTACETTCDSYGKTDIACIQVCKEGCFCTDGYIRGPDGLCILPEQCPSTPRCGVNEEYRTCGTACETTCDNYAIKDLVCPTVCKAGCFCVNGYIRGPDGLCRPPDQCPNQICPNGEVWNSCGTACETTCDNLNQTGRFCTKQCVPGCFCSKGLIRSSDGTCIAPEQCASSTTCGLNEEYNSCGSSCETTCDNFSETGRSCIAVCKEGCFCTDGFIRGPDGICIPPQQCPSAGTCPYGEVWNNCGTACETTCDNYNTTGRICTKQCFRGCFCSDGLIRGRDGTCITPEQCPAPVKCGDDEQYSTCGSACETTCENYQQTDRICTLQCVVGCFCKPGLIRAPDGRCVTADQCPISPGAYQCGENEVWNNCRITCPPQTCESLFASYNCDNCTTCDPGCDCKTGYLRDDTTKLCIPSTECPTRPSIVCGDNEQRNVCGTACEKTCDNYQQTDLVCNKQCVDGCFCNNGLVRASDRSCVLPEQCPISPGAYQCGENEVWNNCRITCPPQTCESLYTSYNCDNNTTCDPGCDCKTGYLRDDTTKLCIPSTECPTRPSIVCGGNEQRNVCGTACEKTCDNYQQTDLVCTEQCVDGCFCNYGLVRASDGSCVLPEQCPISPGADQCGENEVWSDCRITCPPQTCLSPFILPSCLYNSTCEPGCNCKEGYLRDDISKLCIPSSECPKSPPVICGDNEHRNVCGTACEKTCDNYQQTDLVCTEQCVDGCFCNDGLVRASDGSCVLPEQCPPPVICGDNEHRNVCGTACEKTCDNYQQTDLVCTEQCVDGCFCNDGLVRASDGSCVLPEQCPISPGADQCGQNEVWSDCRITCPPQTCLSLFILPNCLYNSTCEPGCNCKEGYLRDDISKLCIPSSECPKSPPVICADNEHRNVCGTACQKTCDNYQQTDLVCTEQCVDGCFCNDGLVRASDGSCVLPEQCPPKQACGKNEVATSCYSPCEKTCKTRFRSDGKICVQACFDGCTCREGYLRNDDGICVPTYKCSPPLCNEDEYFSACGPSCEETCASRNNTCRVCSLRCATGCFCKPGLVRADDGISCVKPDHCPVPVCKENEHFEWCPTLCPPQTCRGDLVRCKQTNQCCQPQCRCDEGYTRNSDGVCIPHEQCTY